jgi:hypothetical protein
MRVGIHTHTHTHTLTHYTHSFTPSESSSSGDDDDDDDDEEGDSALDILTASDGAMRTLVGGMANVAVDDVEVHFVDSDDDAAGGGMR